MQAKGRIFDSPEAQIKLSTLPPASGSRLKWDFCFSDWISIHIQHFQIAKNLNVFHLTRLHPFHLPGIAPNF